MKRSFAIFALAPTFFAGIAHADKLAPPQNTLQPLPVNVQPAVSESVQRSASAQDLQTIQNIQARQQKPNSIAPSNSPLPVTPYVPMSSSDSLALWIALAIAVVVGGGLVWLWKSF